MGYLDTRIGKPSPKVGGRSIKYYHITEKGKRILAESKKIHDRMWLGFGEKVLSPEK
jgi:DNA-binding PadR family transcriptional regulator